MGRDVETIAMIVDGDEIDFPEINLQVKKFADSYYFLKNGDWNLMTSPIYEYQKITSLIM
jgi:hypothetical protein